jgi:hypothetical protein
MVVFGGGVFLAVVVSVVHEVVDECFGEGCFVVFGGEVEGCVEGYVVGASVGGLPEEGAVGEVGDGVAVFVSEAVVVSADGFEVSAVGGSVFGPGLAVVGVAGGGGVSAAVGCAAGFVAGFDEGFFGGDGSAFDVAVVEEEAGGVGYGEFPEWVGGEVEGDLSGDFGDDGSPAGDEAGVVVECHQGGELDLDVDDAAAGCGLDAAAYAQVGVVAGDGDVVGVAEADER